MPNVFRKDLLYPQLSYIITGIAMNVQNELGRYSREKQYCDKLEEKFINENVPHHREFIIGDSGNIADFEVDGKILIEVKAKEIIGKEEYNQVQRYLQASGYELGLLINFRHTYLKTARILRKDPDISKKIKQSQNTPASTNPNITLY